MRHETCFQRILTNLQREYKRRATGVRRKQYECDTSATRATRVQHEWDTSNTSATRMRHKQHECDMSEQVLILITTRVKTYFHIPIFTIWQVKDYQERSNFILSTTFGTASFPWQNAFEKYTSKTGLYNDKSYIKNYTSCDSPRTFLHSYA